MEVETFQNNIPQWKIGKTLGKHIPSTTDHNIIKKFQEYEEICAQKTRLKASIGCV